MRQGCPDSRSFPFDIAPLRSITLDDLRRLFDHTVASQADYLPHWYPDGRFTKRWLTDFHGMLSFVATDAGEPVGVIRLIPSPFVEGGGEMEYLVHPAWRRCGIAKTLCEAVITCTDGRLVKRICPTNHASAGLARKLGFEEQPEAVLGTKIWTLERG